RASPRSRSRRTLCPSTLSLPAALPIYRDPVDTWLDGPVLLVGDAAHAMYPTGSNGATQAIMDARHLGAAFVRHGVTAEALADFRSEEHTSELQSRENLVCRLLLEKKKL